MTILCVIFGCKWKRRGSWPDELQCERCLAVKDRSELTARERRKQARNLRRSEATKAVADQIGGSGG